MKRGSKHEACCPFFRILPYVSQAQFRLCWSCLCFSTSWRNKTIAVGGNVQLYIIHNYLPALNNISATAKKLAVIIWNMVVRDVQYINPEGYLFLDQKRKLGIVKRIQKQIAKFELTTDDLKIITT